MKTIEELNALIDQWGLERGINNLPIDNQKLKIIEECGELARAILNKDKAKQIDAIGDIYIASRNLIMIKGCEFTEGEIEKNKDYTAFQFIAMIVYGVAIDYTVTNALIDLCNLLNLDFQLCVNTAYEEIKDRKGQVINSVFVKEVE